MRAQDEEGRPTLENPVVNVIWKTGDDLRQDSLVVQVTHAPKTTVHDRRPRLPMAAHRFLSGVGWDTVV